MPSQTFLLDALIATRAPRRRSVLAAVVGACTAAACTSFGSSDETANASQPRSQADDRALRAAVDGPQRSAANRARDGARHPFETLRFFGIAPNETVIEIAPGGGWYTEILAPLLRDQGRYYLAADARDAASAESREARQRLDAKLARDAAVYGHVIVGTLPSGAAFTDIAPPRGADAVLTFRNIHNWIEDGSFDDKLRAFHSALKPGGVFGVEEHRAAPGTPLDRIIATGYVPEAYVIEHARAAGFGLAERSEINANPRDDKQHANGVWSLPPTLRGAASLSEAERAQLVAIGESDRMTLKFVKLAK